MSAVQALSLLLLGLCLVLAVWRRINIGVLALAAAFVLVLVSGSDADAMYEHFPGDIVVLIAGVSLLFAHLERSGALRSLVEWIYARLGDRVHLVPWAGFVIAAGLSSAGAFSTAPIALLVPMIAHVCVGRRTNFYLSELAVIIGANCAGLSPLNPTGALVRTIADKYHVHYAVWGVWAVSLTVAVLVVALLQLAGDRLERRGRMDRITPAPADADEPPSVSGRAYPVCAGLALLAFVLLVVLAKTDVGITAMALVVLLQLAFRPPEAVVLRAVPWNSILLLAGLLTYLGLMQDVGTMTSIQHVLGHVGSAAVLLIVMAYLTALLCNIESSTLGVIGLMMPLVFSSFGHQGDVFWVVCAVAVPAALMVMNPIHVAGTLILANSAERDQPVLFRRLLMTAVTLAAVTPGVLSAWPALRHG